MIDRAHLLRLVPVLMLGGLAACAAPSSFDGLTGGNPEPSKELRARSTDGTLDAPRPVSPVSVSFVSSLKPTFRWKASAISTGAVVEICRSRACDGDDVRRIDVEGETVTAPDDLEPGVWFWRLYGTVKERIGTKPSATWEFVVRGPGEKGASDAPAGGMVDINGDGLPDLLVTSSAYDLDMDGTTARLFPTTMIWFGQKDGKLSTRDGYMLDDGDIVQDALGGGIDTDGDGFTDIVRTIKDRTTGEYQVVVEYGSGGKPWEIQGAKGVDYIDWNKHGAVVLPGLTTLPIVREGGDLNGDGYGDVLVSSPAAAVVGLGGAKGTSLSMPLFFGQGPGTVGTRAIVGGFDTDGDGLSDVALANPLSGSPIAAGRGDRERIDVTSDLTARGPSPAEKAIAIASGDFDGDGNADIAATVPFGAVRAVCFWLGSRDKLFVPLTCVPGPPNDATYGDRLTTGDLSGKGKDDVIVSGGEGDQSYLEILGVDGETVMIDRLQELGIGQKLTTIWPGRPGKARWATVDAANTSVLVFEGRDLFQSISLVGRSGDFASPVRSMR